MNFPRACPTNVPCRQPAYSFKPARMPLSLLQIRQCIIIVRCLTSCGCFCSGGLCAGCLVENKASQHQLLPGQLTPGNVQIDVTMMDLLGVIVWPPLLLQNFFDTVEPLRNMQAREHGCIELYCTPLRNIPSKLLRFRAKAPYFRR